MKGTEENIVKMARKDIERARKSLLSEEPETAFILANLDSAITALGSIGTPDGHCPRCQTKMTYGDFEGYVDEVHRLWECPKCEYRSIEQYVNFD